MGEEVIGVYLSYHRGVWHILCPVCQFDFERTKKNIARSWADEHMLAKHPDQLYKVIVP